MHSEQFIQDSFHTFLKSSLTQAKTERLLDVDVLSSAEGDLMITGKRYIIPSFIRPLFSNLPCTGPALCLYFAALRCTTHPPSVPLPRSSSSKSSIPMDLSYENCPPPFVSFLRVWANTVPAIQSLVPEAQHDLARVICGLQPLYDNNNNNNNNSHSKDVVYGIAADLRAVAIEISQRRSFQDRYASDLQAALDADADNVGSKKASFVPPPAYEEEPLPSPNTRRVLSSSLTVPQPSPGLLSPTTTTTTNTTTTSRSTSPSPRSRSPSPSLFPQDSPTIEFIRETLYASLADVIERQSSLRKLLKRDPPRAYFASVSFAILDVAINATTPDGSIIGVLGKRLTISECPPHLRPFMVELCAIGEQAKKMDEEDNEYLIKLVQQGAQDIPVSRLDRVRLMWEKGVGYEHDERSTGAAAGGGVRRSVGGRAVSFANKVNALGLALTKLRQFKERQEHVFKILGGIGS